MGQPIDQSVSTSGLRELLLTKFKPKHKEDFSTPYLVTEDGLSLDGRLKLVGLTGQESVTLRQMATQQVMDKEGNLANELDSAKLAGLCIIKCLYDRMTNQPVFDQLIPTQGPMVGHAADLASLLGMDQEPFNLLGMDVLAFLGMNTTAVEDAKKNLATPQQDGSDSSTSNSQQDSSAPSVNS